MIPDLFVMIWNIIISIDIISLRWFFGWLGYGINNLYLSHLLLKLNGLKRVMG
jgi:hypothetical protein